MPLAPPLANSEWVVGGEARLIGSVALEIVVANVGGNIQVPLLEMTAQKYFKVWEMACFSAFLTARETTINANAIMGEIKILIPAHMHALVEFGADAANTAIHHIRWTN